MADCEICGREAQLYTVEIDRARLRVCFDCSKSGKLIEVPRHQHKPNPKGSAFQPTLARQATELELVQDHGPCIKAAREKMHITREVLAEMINEKESFLERVESGRALPTEVLVRKLEKALGISLYEEVGVGSQGASRAEKKGLTLGDIITVRKKGETDEKD